MILTYVVFAVLLCAATVAARGSARRLMVAGAVGTLIAFFIQPLALMTGAYSRHLVAPTPLGFVAVQPLLLLMVIAGAAVLLTVNRPRSSAVLSVAAGVVVLGLLLLFSVSAQSVIAVRSVPWVLETLIPLGVAVIGVSLTRSLLLPHQRPVGYALSLAAGVVSAWFLFSNAAPVTFDALRDYYRVAVSATDAQQRLVVEDWRKDLEFNNGDRTRINAEWDASERSIANAKSALQKAEATVQSSAGGQALEFAQNARREAERSLLDAGSKRDALMRQKLEYGLTDPNQPLEPLIGVASAAELPRGYSVGRDAAESGARRVFPHRIAYGFATLAFFGILLLLGGATLLWRGTSALEVGDVSSGTLLALVVAVLAYGFNAVEFDLGRFIRGFPFIEDFARRAVPPDWNGILSEGLKAMAITIATAMIGTVLAALLALPSSFLAARNLTQKSWWGRTVYPLMRGFYNLDRGVDTLILALIFVAAVGLGPLAGVLAMAIHSMADLGKLYSEAIENAEQGPIEALEAAGAPGVSIIRWAVLPQVLPLFVSYTLYRFEINFRVSIILGFVGAGGVGFLIQETMRSGKYNQMIILVGLVVVMVNILDFISATVRRRLVR